MQHNRSAQRAFFHLCIGRLVDVDAIEQLRCEYVEVERAAGLALRDGLRHRVIDRDSRELRIKTTYRDIAAFTALTSDRDARDACQRFGQVLIREVSDVLRHDAVNDTCALTLRGECSPQTAPEACDDNFLKNSDFLSFLERLGIFALSTH